MLQELLKYTLTGIIAFGASVFYTNYQLEPARNITLVPISILNPNSKIACTVDQNELNAKLESLTRDKAERGEPLHAKSNTYEYYLRTLSTYERVLEEYVPPMFLSTLKEDGILDCNDRASGVTVEAAAILEEKVPYLMRRSCFISYDGAKIPIRVSGGASNNEQTFLVGETRNLLFYYDENKGNEATERQFAQLAKEVAEKEVKLSVTCHVIGTDKEKEIGGRSYSVGASQ